jgi:FlgD Ig-like domain
MHFQRTSVSCRPTICLTMLLVILAAPALVAASTCVQPDAGGTIILPPSGPGCPYISPNDFHMIINGLPPGTTIEVGASHEPFDSTRVHMPGGSLGGEVELFDSVLHLTMHGTGALSGFDRDLDIDANCETNTAPRIPGAPIQSFDTDMVQIQGQLPPGDPDFDLLRVTAGTGAGMPSPGHTTLTYLLPSGTWNVDSFFDITYRIDFIGHPGGPLGGLSGSTTATIRMQSGEELPVPPCTVVDNGSGTIDLPPDGCGYVSPADLHMMIDGLPPGTEIHVDAIHQGFFNETHTPGGSLGGQIEDFSSSLHLELTGTGELDGFHRTIEVPATCETQTAPRTPGDPVQSFDTLMYAIDGQLPPSGNDPDFQQLQVTAGDGFGLPSPGHTTLTQLAAQPLGSWNVDSFFDITYHISFVGAPGGQLAGLAGTTLGTVHMQAGQPAGGTPAPEIAAQLKNIALSGRPNPFSSPGTSIAFRLPAAASVRLAVYDVTGQLVRTLTDERTPEGPHAIFWDGRDNSGRRLSTGVYFARIMVDGKDAGTTKLTMIK